MDMALDLKDLFLSKFADDTKAARVVDNDSEAELPRRNLNGFSKWAEDWQMCFNVEKCKVIHIGRTNPRHDYFMGGKKLLEIEEEKDLGVIIHQSLTPSSNVAKSVKKANLVLRQLPYSDFTNKKVKIQKAHLLLHLFFKLNILKK